MGRSQYLVVRTFQEVTSELPGRPGRILRNQNVYILGIWASWCIITDYYYCFLQTDTVSCMVATSRLYVTVSYGSCMIAASDLYSTVSYGDYFVQYYFLWRSCADAECNMYVPWVYHLAAKQGCTDVRVWLPKLGGLNIFCAHVSRGYLWASPFCFVLFCFAFNFCRRWESD